MGIRITSVKIYPFDSGEPTARVKAYAEITLDNCLTIKGFKVVADNKGGVFVGFPSQKGKDGNYRDLVIPLTSEVRNKIRDEVLDAFRNFY
jgi:stage V sporulation protein G